MCDPQGPATGGFVALSCIVAPSTPPPPLPAAPPRPPGDGVDPTADRMLAAARQGSNKAWAALIERVDPECRRLAHLVLGGHDVDRTLLSAYVRAYRARRKGPPDAVVFLTHHVWIACGHEIRRHQRREAPAPGRRPVHTDRRPRLGADALGQAVARLRPEERAIWGLVDEAGFPVAAVAKALGVDAKVVTTVASRVARLLDEALEEPTGAMEVLGGDDEGRPDLGKLGEDTSAVMATEPSTIEAPSTDDVAEPPEDDDAGQLEPDPATPGFWRELGRRLRAERAAPQAAPPPPLPGPGDPSPSLTAAKAPPVAMQKRAPAKIRRRRPDVVEELAGEVDRQRPRRHWAGTLVKGAAILIVLGVLGAAVTALYLAASRAESPVKGETVADVAADSMEVLGDAPNWSATIEREALAAGGGIEQASLKVSVDSEGSYRVEDTTIDRITTFDATAGTLQDVVPGFPPRAEIGVALAPPDGGPPRDGFPLDDLGIAARTLATVDDEPPVRAKLNGRSVYRLTGPLTDEIDLTYTVDADSLYPVRITWTVDDQQVRELRFADVQLDTIPGPFTQDLPPGTPTATNLGFVPVGITEVARRTEIQPLTPDFLPSGFVAAGVVVNESERITQLRYARGPQELLITLRPSPVEAGNVWDDPFPRPEGQEVAPTDVAIEGGPFRGVTAQQVAGPQALPSLWAADGELAFTVAGDVTPDELLRIAQSLRSD
jgi:DNA-directed RNA polymerase specialized sigma24 family protein